MSADVSPVDVRRMAEKLGAPVPKDVRLPEYDVVMSSGCCHIMKITHGQRKFLLKASTFDSAWAIVRRLKAEDERLGQ